MPSASDIWFARELDRRRTVQYLSPDWPRIGELQRRRLVKVVVITRYVAEVFAIGAAAISSDECARDQQCTDPGSEYCRCHRNAGFRAAGVPPPSAGAPS